MQIGRILPCVVCALFCGCVTASPAPPSTAGPGTQTAYVARSILDTFMPTSVGDFVFSFVELAENDIYAPLDDWRTFQVDDFRVKILLDGDISADNLSSLVKMQTFKDALKRRRARADASANVDIFLALQITW